MKSLLGECRHQLAGTSRKRAEAIFAHKSFFSQHFGCKNKHSHCSRLHTSPSLTPITEVLWELFPSGTAKLLRALCTP